MRIVSEFGERDGPHQKSAVRMVTKSAVLDPTSTLAGTA
jgi:hypothetical protein